MLTSLYSRFKFCVLTQLIIDKPAIGSFSDCLWSHPDMMTSGGTIETKKIAEYANMFGILVKFHMAGSPVGCMASVHCACLVDDFISMENHSVDTEWWGDLVTGIDKPIIVNGEYTVPEKPGLGVELSDEETLDHSRLL